MGRSRALPGTAAGRSRREGASAVRVSVRNAGVLSITRVEHPSKRWPAVNVRNRSHTIVGEIDEPGEGVVLAQGGRFGGFSLYVKEGPAALFLQLPRNGELALVVGAQGWGAATLGFEFEKTGAEMFGAGGVGRLLIDGEAAGETELPRTVPFVFALGGGLECGRDSGNLVTERYKAPFSFTGKIKKVVVEVQGSELRDLVREARIELARQ